MQFKLEKSLRDYVNAGDETTTQFLESASSLVLGAEKFDSFFRKHLWSAPDVEMSPTQAFLSMHAFMLWLSAVRMALTGHAAATYPLFRTSLESACYAFLMREDASLEQIWNDRHKSKEAMRESRNRFTPAVKESAHIIEAAKPGSGLAEALIEAYQAAIDFGAHPNPRSIYHHVRLRQETEKMRPVELIGLYSPDNFEAKRSLLACLDHGMLLAVILTSVPSSAPADIQERLNHLNEMKEQITREYFPDTL